MALLATRTISEALLDVFSDSGATESNHIFEPEFHQAKYVNACKNTRSIPGSFQLGSAPGLECGPVRGVQPSYADSEDDSDSLEYEGMIRVDGSMVGNSSPNVCALKSNCIRRGYIDYSLARSVSREFHKKKPKSHVIENDVLINSTGDGTIGRVAVYNAKFPAMVDGHVTILRFKDPDTAWYVAAFLLSDIGQKQLYRYINGSSGQVEIYPQDIARIWVKPPTNAKHKKHVAASLRQAAGLHLNFYQQLQSALAQV